MIDLFQKRLAAVLAALLLSALGLTACTSDSASEFWTETVSEGDIECQGSEGDNDEVFACAVVRGMLVPMINAELTSGAVPIFEVRAFGEDDRVEWDACDERYFWATWCDGYIAVNAVETRAMFNANRELVEGSVLWAFAESLVADTEIDTDGGAACVAGGVSGLMVDANDTNFEEVAWMAEGVFGTSSARDHFGEERSIELWLYFYDGYADATSCRGELTA